MAQIELLNKLNKCKNSFIIITQEPYCYKATLALMSQNARTIPMDRIGHPRESITASNRLQMAEITEAGFLVPTTKLFSSYARVMHEL